MDTKSFVCDECDPPCEFANKANYNRHRVSEHGYSVKFKCTICKISFSQHTKLQEHLKDKHNASSDAKNIKEMSEICLVKPSSATVTSTATSSAAVIPAAASTATEAATSTTIATISKESNTHQHFQHVCRCCLLDNSRIDNKEQFLSMRDEAFIHNNQKVIFIDAYSDVIQSSIDQNEPHICGICAIFLENAYLFRKLCQDVQQFVHNACRCCLHESGDSNDQLLKMKTESFMHNNIRITFLEGYFDVNKNSVNISKISEAVICEKCAVKMESAYIFQRMCENANGIFQGKRSLEKLVAKQPVTYRTQTVFEPNEGGILYTSNEAKTFPKQQINGKDETNISERKMKRTAESTIKVFTEKRNLRSSSKRDQTVQPSKIQEPEKPQKPKLKFEHPSLAQTFSIAYNCKKCTKKFSSKIGLNSHRIIKHRNTYSTRELYKKIWKRQLVPIIRNVNSKRYACKKCEKVYRWKEDLTVHNKTVHQIHQCNKCPKVFLTADGLETHRQVTHQNNRYHCQECDRNFSRPVLLLQHNNCVHQKKGFKCIICANVYSHMSGLYKHSRDEHSKILFACKLCGRVYHNSTDLARHHKAVHLRLRFQCKVCPKKYTRIEALKMHNRSVHQNNPFVCQICEKTFKTGSGLYNHNAASHLNILHKCQKCPKTFTKSTSLKYHNYEMHLKKEHPCKRCDKVYKSRTLLQRHQNSIHFNTHLICQECKKVFKTPGGRIQHERSIHLQIKLQCKECPNVYKSSTTLNKHIKSVHLKQRYECTECKKMFTMQAGLYTHMRNVHQKQTYSCDKCDKVFKSGSWIREHTEIEHLKKRYTCPECGNVFTTERGLLFHNNNVHLNIPHRCNQCPNTYRTRSGLSDHKRKCHPAK